ncbi:hypothetical protein EPO56_01685 [Patescibacteria group bacterium]|nr:MAG: hypothetical protein EPO56_01685 [Patescibacteria group bacterium]
MSKTHEGEYIPPRSAIEATKVMLSERAGRTASVGIIAILTALGFSVSGIALSGVGLSAAITKSMSAVGGLLALATTFYLINNSSRIEHERHVNREDEYNFNQSERAVYPN